MDYDLSSTVVTYNSNYGQVTVRVFNYAASIWSLLMSIVGNEYGVAGIMGNWQVESYNCPFCKQGNTPPTQVSVDYSNAIDNGSVTKNKFVTNQLGYSLAQWSYPTRKSDYWDFWKASGISQVGDVNVAVGFALSELQGGHKSTLEVCQNATDIKTASDYVLHHYEQPADQSFIQENLRAGYGEYYYSVYAGTDPPVPPIPPIPPTPTPTKKEFKTLLYLRNNYFKTFS